MSNSVELGASVALQFACAIGPAERKLGMHIESLENISDFLTTPLQFPLLALRFGHLIVPEWSQLRLRRKNGILAK